MQIQHSEGLVLGKDTIVSTNIILLLTFHWWQSCLKTKSYGKAIQRKPLSCGTKIKSFFSRT